MHFVHRARKEDGRVRERERERERRGWVGGGGSVCHKECVREREREREREGGKTGKTTNTERQTDTKSKERYTDISIDSN